MGARRFDVAAGKETIRDRCHWVRTSILTTR